MEAQSDGQMNEKEAFANGWHCSPSIPQYVAFFLANISIIFDTLSCCSYHKVVPQVSLSGALPSIGLSPLRQDAPSMVVKQMNQTTKITLTT